MSVSGPDALGAAGPLAFRRVETGLTMACDFVKPPRVRAPRAAAPLARVFALP
ncbi:MAG: hypothetical protein ACJAVS_001656 [Paracoccaceae bacterium]|jgi:hypothetical protein